LLERAAADLLFRHGAEWSACSARGLNRERTADAFAVAADGKIRAFAVADGVGSLPCSPVVSIAAALAAVDWAAGLRGTVGEKDIDGLVFAVDASVLHQLSLNPGAGATTLASAFIDGEQGLVMTVGDSEVLAIDREGPARRLTEPDHVPSQPNVLLAWVDGTSPFTPHIIALDVLPHRLCLVTDGIVKVLSYDRIADIARESLQSEGARNLVLAARHELAGDDVTAIVIGNGAAGDG
jgi:serine/threonine protein phosphatase PrpC